MNPPKRTPKSSRPTPMEWMCRKLDIPDELVDGDIRLELHGRRCLSIHGCTRILDFSPAEVRLALGKQTLTVWGEGLLCTSFLSGDVGVEGHIYGLRFEDGEGKVC